MAHVYRNMPERDDTNALTNPHHLAASTPSRHTSHDAAQAEVMWDDADLLAISRSAWLQAWHPLGSDAPGVHMLPEVIAAMTKASKHAITTDPIGDYRPFPVNNRQIKGTAMPKPHMLRVLATMQAIQGCINDYFAHPATAMPLAEVIARALTLMQEALPLSATLCWLAQAAPETTEVVIQSAEASHPKSLSHAMGALARQAYHEQRQCQTSITGDTMVTALPLGQGEARYGALVFTCSLNHPLSDEEVSIAEMIALQIAGILALEKRLDAMRAEAQFWNAVIDSQPNGLILYDRHHNIISYSQAALELAVNRDEVLAARAAGQNVTPIWQTLWPDETEIAATDTPSACVIATGDTTQPKEVWVRQDSAKPQTKTQVLVNAAPIFDGAAALQGAVVSFHDITTMKAVQGMKFRRVDNVRHDIRTPLTYLLLRAQWWFRRPELLTPEKIRQDAASMVAAIRHIERDMNSLANLDTIGDPPEKMSLVEHVLAYKTEQCQHFGINRIKCDIQAVDSVLEGYWSLREIDSVIDNLIQNAIKYSPDGTPITVRLYPTEHNGKRMAHMEVIDQGYGVPAEAKTCIFDDGYRSVTQTPDGHDIPGTGRGLNFCKTAVRMHDGFIWVESPGIGLGSTFHVELPLAP